MTNDNINTRLKKLYSSKWTKFSFELKNIVNSEEYKIKPANPLVLSHTNPIEFENSKIKVMILGQENNKWEGTFNGDLQRSLDTYSEFYDGKYFYHKGQFKNHFNLLVDLLKEHFDNESIGIFWSNVIKVGKSEDKNLPPEYILNTTINEFNVLEGEIEIIKPDIIFFLSGPDYDKHIKSQINDLKVKNYKDYSLKEVAQLEIPNVKYAFRTYHPTKMNFLGKEKYKKIYSDLISELKHIR